MLKLSDRGEECKALAAGTSFSARWDESNPAHFNVSSSFTGESFSNTSSFLFTVYIFCGLHNLNFSYEDTTF